MRFLFFLILTIKVVTLSSQILEISDKSLDAAIFTVNLMNRNYDSAIGSPYIKDEFVPAKINNGSVTQFVRFNCVDDEVEVKQGMTKVLLLDLAKNQKISLSDGSEKIYHIYKYKDKNKKAKVTFLELIKEDKQYRLYKKVRKKFIPKQNAEGYREATQAEFVRLNTIHFITDFQSKTDKLLAIPTKKKKFFSFFGKKKGELERFTKDEKLDYLKSEDLEEIIAFYFKQF